MEENMRRAQNRDAVGSEKFFFRKSLVPEDKEDEEEGVTDSSPKATVSHDHEYTQMNIDTVINGKVR